MTLLKVSGISKKEGGRFLLRDIRFSQKRLQRIAIAGETGSGKSTLLKIIAGLTQSDAGEVLFENKRVEGPEETLVPGHPEIAYLSQHFELAKSLRIEQVLSYANTLPDEEARTLYEVCQINHLLARKTDQLSGGERQRIALTRLLTTWPDLLLLDEPFSNLDMAHKSTLKAVIKDISDRLGITCILISHDPADILSWANEIIVMKAGEIIQKGRPEEIYQQPINEYVAGLFGKYNLISSSRPKAFHDLSGVRPDGKTMLVRPEQVKITAESDLTVGVKGKVKQIKFFGSYYEIEVLVSGEIIVVKSENNSFSIGDTVYLSLLTDSDRQWYI